MCNELCGTLHDTDFLFEMKLIDKLKKEKFASKIHNFARKM